LELRSQKKQSVYSQIKQEAVFIMRIKKLFSLDLSESDYRKICAYITRPRMELEKQATISDAVTGFFKSQLPEACRWVDDIAAARAANIAANIAARKRT
jgi:hypothetical protein